MTPALRVFAPETVRAARTVDAVLRSLPLSYGWVDEQAAGTVTVVDGSGDWPAAVASAVRAGSAGILIVQPSPADVGDLRDLLPHDGPVVVDSTWASNPLVSDARTALAASVTSWSRVECRILSGVAQDQDRDLVDQLSLVRALVGPVDDLEALHVSDHGFVGVARVGDVVVDLSIVCTEALPRQAHVRLLTADGSVELMVPSGETAAPARLTVTDPNGIHTRPSHYESGHRAAWRRLHQLITTGEATSDLDGLSDDILLATRLGAPTTTAKHPAGRSTTLDEEPAMVAGRE